MIKKIIPPETRLQLRVLQRNLKDTFNGQKKKFVSKNAKQSTFLSQFLLSQPIKANQYSKNKIHNLHLAVSYIEKKVILQNDIFSFWHLIPQPTSKNGFKKGRNLIGEGLAADFGGGLCQLSGILYHLSLLAGFEILERYPHSKDIYTEATRFTPLGSDATIVYGHKDLRIKNNLSQPISFSFEIKEDAIIAHLCGAEPIEQRTLIFEAIDHGDYQIAKVGFETSKGIIPITKDKYFKLHQ